MQLELISGPILEKGCSRPPARYDQKGKKREEKGKKSEFSIHTDMNGRSQIAPGPVPTKLHPEFQYSAYHISTLKRRQHRPGITLRLLCPCKPTLPTDYRDSDCGKVYGDEARRESGEDTRTRTHTQSLSSQSFYQGGAASVI